MRISLQFSNKKRPTTNELKSIYTTIKNNPHLAFRRLRNLKKQAAQGNILLALDQDKIVGWIEHYHLWKDWWGLSSLYVLPEYRDQGIGRGKLLPYLVKHHNCRKIYAATINSKVWPALESLGFKQTKLYFYPLPLILKLVWLRYMSFTAVSKLFTLSKNTFRYYKKA